MTTYTPMIQQYLQIKQAHEEAFLFFRLGDFYELFFDDAIRASSILEITLTSREAAKGKERIPMCGVPYHSATNYIETLVQKGYKVAICEQVEDPKEVKGLVKREVVKIVTPGTLTEGKTVDATSHHFIGAIHFEGEASYLAYVDLATGIAKCEVVHGTKEDVLHVADALQIRELVLAEQDDAFEKYAKDRHFLISFPTMDGEVKPSLVEALPKTAVEAATLIWRYLQETQKTSLDHIQPFEWVERAETLTIDANSMRNLELVRSIRNNSKEGTLYELLDVTTTAMGARKLKMWLHEPLANERLINERLDRVDALIEAYFTRDALKKELKSVYDLERLAGRIAMGSASGRDLAQLRDSLQHVPAITQLLRETEVPALTLLAEQLNPCVPLRTLLEEAIAQTPPISVKEEGTIRDGYDEQLDRLRDASRNGKTWLQQLEREEREKTGIKNLKIGYNRIFGYFIEVTRANAALMDEARYERKQTLANTERFITEELKEKEALILNAEEQSLELEYTLFTQVRSDSQAHIQEVQQLAHHLSELDVLIAFADLAERYHYVRPTFHEGRALTIKNGRHPVVEQMMDAQLYVPNDCELTESSNMLLITGPNMSGKSTYMRQVALTIVMAQIGSYVPCDRAHLPITDQIFTRIGAADDLASGQSTFMMEMMESQYAITHASPRSLLLFDEIGRGTSTYDGMSLAQAMMEYIHDEIGANTLFSTHYHELTSLEQNLDQLRNVHVQATEQDGDVVFLHKVAPGAADRSYGIHVAKLAKLPESILTRAGQLLTQFESETQSLEKISVEQQVEEVIQEQPAQLSFFEEVNKKEPVIQTTHPVEEEIQQLDLLNMTPLEALQQLAEWQKKWR